MRAALLLLAGLVLTVVAPAAAADTPYNASRVRTVSLYAPPPASDSPEPSAVTMSEGRASAADLAEAVFAEVADSTSPPELASETLAAGADASAAEPVTIEASADLPYRFEVRREEWLRDALARWASDHGIELLWLAKCDYPVIVDFTFEADSFEDATRQLLRNAWHPSCPLGAREPSNNVLVIQ